MGLAKRADSSIGYQQFGTTKTKEEVPLTRLREGNFTLEEVFGGIPDEDFTLEEALEFMDVTESEFLELLIASGNCSSGKLEKNQTYSTELIFAIDPGKWKIY